MAPFRRYELEEILDNHEMAALVAGAPQIGNVLRPLHRMMAFKLPASLRLPRRRAPNRPTRPRPTIIRLDAGDLWRGPGIWETREEAQKFDAKIRVWPD